MFFFYCLQPSEEVLGETNNYSLPQTSIKIYKKRGRKRKQTLNPKAEEIKPLIKDESDLLTLKEPNKRELERVISQPILKAKRGRKRRVDLLNFDENLSTSNNAQTPTQSFNAAEVPESMPIFCTVCRKKDFTHVQDYNNHFLRNHTPRVLEHGCTACHLAFYDSEEYRDHQNWHRIYNQPYNCFKCNKSYEKLTGFTRHLTHNCVPTFFTLNLVDDIKCDQCKEVFVTLNLYDWHKCFIQSNRKCRKCSRLFYKKNLLFKHMFECKGAEIAAAQLAATMTKSSTEIKSSLRGQNKRSRRRKGSKVTFAAPPDEKPMKIVKRELDGCLEVQIEEQDNFDDFDGFDDHHNNDDDDYTMGDDGSELPESSQSIPRIESTQMSSEQHPMVRIKAERIEPSTSTFFTTIPIEPTTTKTTNTTTSISKPPTQLTVQIKQERLCADYGDTVQSTQPDDEQPPPTPPRSSTAVDENIIRNIKRERVTASIAASKVTKATPTLRIKIKKEHGTLNSAYVERDEAEDEDESLGGENEENHQADKEKDIEPEAQPKRNIYKIPKKLAFLIKKEIEQREQTASNIQTANEDIAISEEVTGAAQTDALDSTSQTFENSESFRNNHHPVDETNIQMPIITDVITVVSLNDIGGVEEESQLSNTACVDEASLLNDVDSEDSQLRHIDGIAEEFDDVPIEIQLPKIIQVKTLHESILSKETEAILNEVDEEMGELPEEAMATDECSINNEIAEEEIEATNEEKNTKKENVIEESDKISEDPKKESEKQPPAKIESPELSVPSSSARVESLDLPVPSSPTPVRKELLELPVPSPPTRIESPELSVPSLPIPVRIESLELPVPALPTRVESPELSISSSPAKVVSPKLPVLSSPTPVTKESLELHVPSSPAKVESVQLSVPSSPTPVRKELLELTVPSPPTRNESPELSVSASSTRVESLELPVSPTSTPIKNESLELHVPSPVDDVETKIDSEKTEIHRKEKNTPITDTTSNEVNEQKDDKNKVHYQNDNSNDDLEDVEMEDLEEKKASLSPVVESSDVLKENLPADSDSVELAGITDAVNMLTEIMGQRVVDETEKIPLEKKSDINDLLEDDLMLEKDESEVREKEIEIDSDLEKELLQEMDEEKLIEDAIAIDEDNKMEITPIDNTETTSEN